MMTSPGNPPRRHRHYTGPCPRCAESGIERPRHVTASGRTDYYCAHCLREKARARYQQYKVAVATNTIKSQTCKRDTAYDARKPVEKPEEPRRLSPQRVAEIQAMYRAMVAALESEAAHA